PDKFDFLTNRKMTTLLNRSKLCRFIVVVNNCSEIIRCRFLFRCIDMILCSRNIKEKPCIKRSISCLINFIKPFLLQLVMLGIIEISINSLSVRIYDRCNIMNALHSTLNLKAVDPHLNEIRNMLNHAQILRAHCTWVFALFINWRSLAQQVLFPATGLAAATTIGISIRKVIG